MSEETLRRVLPYRPCVGIMVLNDRNEAFVGRRIGFEESFGDQNAWQMPQGGIDPGEDPWLAAQRELFEETNIRQIDRLREIDGWLNYDLPTDTLGKALKGRFRGQTQKWFVVRLKGSEAEIDVQNPGNGAHPAEFDAWKWVPIGDLPDIVVPFKREVYLKIVTACADLDQASI